MVETRIKNRSRWPAVVMALALLSPLAYVLSYGPVSVLMATHHFSAHNFRIVYWPIYQISGHWQAAADVLDTYQEWWFSRYIYPPVPPNA